jgi:hypothetical protein
MQIPAEAVFTLDDLRAYVHRILCEKENLLADQFKMIESKLTRGSRDCGLQFTLHGPRSVRLSAIWESGRNTVYFYDAGGERYATVRLPRCVKPVEPEVETGCAERSAA